MAKKPTITTVATGYNATDTVNANFTNIRNAFDNTLSLDGSTPNAMEADLDMNSKDILNVKNIYADNIIYEGALPIVNGGTGATTASGARTNLGLGTMATESSSDYLTTATASSTYLTQSSAASTYLTQTTADGIYQPLDGDLTSIAGLSGTSGILKKTGASTYTLDTTTYLTSAAIGVTVQGYDADLTTLGGLSKTDGNFIVGDGTTWVVESGSTARASLGLGTMATETASNYLTTSTAASTYQPLDSDLTTIAGLAKTDGNFIVGDGTNWVTESGATVRASLGLGTMATETASNYLTTSSAASTYLTQTNAASTYQPLDSDLTAISSLSNADNNFIVGNGTTWVAESGNTARTSLGLGTGDSPTFTGLTLSGIGSFSAGTALLPSLTTTGDTNTGMWFPAADTVAWSTGGTERMRLDSNGFLGINTSSPSVLVDIRSALAFQPQLLVLNSTVDAFGPYWNTRKLRGTAAANSGDDLGTFMFQSADTSGTARNAVWIVAKSQGAGATYHSGYFDVNVISPAGAFTNVFQMSSNGVRVGPAGTVSLPSISQVSDPDTGMWFPTANTLAWSTGGSERMRITSAGNLGLGTSTFGTSAATTFAIATGTAPTTGPADTIQIYSTDLSAGNTMLSLYTEGTVVNANTTAATTHRIAIRVNGTVYYLLANTAA